MFAAIFAVLERQSGSSDFGPVCRDWMSCGVMISLYALLPLGVTWTFSLLLFGWSKRTSQWVNLGGFVTALIVAAWIALL